MPILDLSIDELLSTTRSVRKRLDLTRPVEPEVIRECLSLAVQAPTPGSMQNWHFIVVTEPAQRERLADLYRKAAHSPGGQEDRLKQMIAAAADEQEAARLTRVAETPRYLTAHMHEIPIHIIPCVEDRTENLSAVEQASLWGGIWPATWSFMLAARSRGLGTSSVKIMKNQSYEEVGMVVHNSIFAIMPSRSSAFSLKRSDLFAIRNAFIPGNIRRFFLLSRPANLFPFSRLFSHSQKFSAKSRVSCKVRMVQSL